MLVCEEMKWKVEFGMSIKDFDFIGKVVFDEYGVVLVFEKEYDFLGVICISVNDEVVYGILSIFKILKVGDFVNIDILVEFGGFYFDIGILFVFGEGEECFYKFC